MRRAFGTPVFFLCAGPGSDIMEAGKRKVRPVGIEKIRRKRQLGKWRRKWAQRVSGSLKRERFQRRLKVCLAAALMAEGLWFAFQAVSVKTWEQEMRMESGEEDHRLIRGLRLQIEDGELQLFQVQEHVQPETKEGETGQSD